MATNVSATGEVNATWSQIIYFRTQKSFFTAEETQQAYVFSNTRQQCEISVWFIAADGNGNQVFLTPEEIKNQIKLINYNNNDPIPYGNIFYHHPEWLSSSTSRKYTWNEKFVEKVASRRKSEKEENNAEGSEDESERKCVFEWEKSMGINRGGINTHPIISFRLNKIDKEVNEQYKGPIEQCVKFLISTSATIPIQIAAEISTVGGTGTPIIVRTSDKIDDPNGKGDGNGRFNSSVVIHPIKFPSLPIENYGIKESGSTNILDDYLVAGEIGKGFRAYEQRINVRYDGEELTLKSAISPILLIVSAWADLGEAEGGAEWSFTYLGQPGSREFSSLPPPYLLFNDWITISTYDLLNVLVTSIKNASNKYVVIGQVMGNDNSHFYGSEGRASENRSTPFYILDEHGNAHKIEVYIPDGNQLNCVGIRTW